MSESMFMLRYDFKGARWRSRRTLEDPRLDPSQSRKSVPLARMTTVPILNDSQLTIWADPNDGWSGVKLVAASSARSSPPPLLPSSLTLHLNPASTRQPLILS